MKSQWIICGYCVDRPGFPAFAQAIFSRPEGPELFIQASLIESIAPKLLAFDGLPDFPLAEELAYNPTEDQIVGCAFAKDDVQFWGLETFRQLAENNKIEARALEVLRPFIETPEEMDGRLTNLVNDKWIANSISRNAFYEILMDDLARHGHGEQCFSKVVAASKFMVGWTTQSIPREKLSAALEKSSYDANSLNDALKSRMLETAHLSAVFKEDHSSEIEFAKILRSISGASRQELRLSRFLSTLLEKPKLGERIFSEYRPWAVAETAAHRRLQTFKEDWSSFPRNQRAHLVAHLIPELVRLQFGSRRGQFIVDLARSLAHDPIVREALLEEFHRRSHTWAYSEAQREFTAALDEKQRSFPWGAEGQQSLEY
ncbi:hypothetical protein [Qipengyuania sp.]|uniref:hypothetical protein n=1 Tax=Qipengyuania sp. TaxID=2004515 RepID=UPI003517FE26